MLTLRCPTKNQILGRVFNELALLTGGHRLEKDVPLVILVIGKIIDHVTTVGRQAHPERTFLTQSLQDSERPIPDRDESQAIVLIVHDEHENGFAIAGPLPRLDLSSGVVAECARLGTIQTDQAELESSVLGPPVVRNLPTIG
jgi:hypothetical protein